MGEVWCASSRLGSSSESTCKLGSTILSDDSGPGDFTDTSETLHAVQVGLREDAPAGYSQERAVDVADIGAVGHW